MNCKSVTLLAIAMMLVAWTVPGIADDSDASSAIEVTDGLGNTFTFDEPANKIISIGTGAIATVIGVGALDKLVVCDSYVKKDNDPIFDDLKEKCNNGEIRANGNLWSLFDELKKDIIYASGDDGSFDKGSDVIILCGTEEKRSKLITELGDSYANILQWNTITEYDEVVDFVKTISLVCTGGISEKVEQMEYATRYIKDKFVAEHIPARNAFYVTYSGGDYKVGNNGSLANSMILAACGNSITIDSTKSGTTYGVGISGLTMLIKEYGSDTVVFVDNTIVSDADRLDSVRGAVGDARLVPLKPIWNNFSIESIDGVWTMACAMYPDVFEGDVPEVPPKEDNMMVFAIAGISVAVILGILGFIFIRRM